jgi:hypothetical protein
VTVASGARVGNGVVVMGNGVGVRVSIGHGDGNTRLGTGPGVRVGAGVGTGLKRLHARVKRRSRGRKGRMREKTD